MKYTRMLKIFAFLGLILSLLSCNNSMTQSVIYRLEDEGYQVNQIELDEVERVDPEFEVTGAQNVYEIYNKADKVIAYLYEFEEESDIDQMFQEKDLNIALYEEQIHENLLIVPYENINYITNIIPIIKR